MPVTVAALADNPHDIKAPTPIPVVVTLRGEHEIFTPTPPALPNTAARIDDVWTPHANNSKVKVLAAAANPLGHTYYLPYDNNKITSLRLPDPPPAGVNVFFTANMSGCKFYVDTINGSADVMVYHANARDTAAAPAHTAVNFQDPIADAELDRLHTAAQADYAAAPYGLVLANAASMAKPVYYGNGALAEQRKVAQGRTMLFPQNGQLLPLNPEFWGGCSIFGFYNAGWRFYYQTWGAVEYERNQLEGKKDAAKAIFTLHWNYLYKLSKPDFMRQGIDMKYAKVVDHARFY